MSFVAILAIVLGGGTVLVSADYYIELREQAAGASSSRTQPNMATYLYHCRGDPVGTPALRAVRSICTLVSSNEQKRNVYHHCNFFRVYNPYTQGHVIHLVGHGVLSAQSWYLGVLNNNMDQPNLAEPQQRDLTHSAVKISEIGSIHGVASLERNRLIFYFAQNNLFSYAKAPDTANLIFNSFVTLLKSLTEQYFSIDQANETKQFQFATAMEMALQKMIDPCSVLQTSTSDYCNTYCHFLNLAALYFQVIWTGGCTALNGGQCVGAVCTCINLATNPFAGCQTSPMQQCNNSLRLKLNLD